MTIMTHSLGGMLILNGTSSIASAFWVSASLQLLNHDQSLHPHGRFFERGTANRCPTIMGGKLIVIDGSATRASTAAPWDIPDCIYGGQLGQIA